MKKKSGGLNMNNTTAFLLRPFQFEGTKLHPNVLLMCKLLVILMTAHHIITDIEDPFVPFIAALDGFNDYPYVFKYTLRTLYVLSAFALIFNIKVRTASITIGLVVILNMLGSLPLFANHTFICGCALFLAGLTNDKEPPYLLILQLSLVYFGASINKFLEPDWWSGAFMDTWLGTARHNAVYLYVSELLPELLLAKLLSYIAMFTEFAIAVLILFKRTRHLTLWFIIIFHTSLFTLTAFRFGHFLESLALVLLAFLSIPKAQLIVNYKSQSLETLKRFFKFLDRDQKQVWSPLSSENSRWLSLKTTNKTLYNHDALKDILLYTPNFFVLLLFIDMAIYILLYNHRTALFVLNVIFVWSVILYFLPFNWFRKKSDQ
ncbi:HTTM domain-containing protein [Psychroserpens sp.]|uniref:HTTM domain-containing protein n=1 Tax=Psychroserpens sp. TaxID=2020870 RepID=UPI002B272CB6|nr:HTTM domain-containing protein [Psychroserpens sp.]